MQTTITNTFSDFIHGNPFNTPVGSLIEESTEDFVSAELWQLFTQAVDLINRTPSGPKDAVRALRRRFSAAVGANETVAMHSLLLLEACMLNCGYRFHLVLANRDALRDFTRFVTPGSVASLSPGVREKLLGLIKTWAMNFSDQVDLQEFRIVYQELISQNVTFPEVSSLRSNPTLPSRPISAVSSGDATHRPDEPNRPMNIPTPVNHQTVPISERTASANLRTEKLQSDLAQVRINICVMSDLISEAEAKTDIPEETRLLMKDIALALYEMSRRMIQAISYWENCRDSMRIEDGPESVMLDMIDVNDELHTVLSRYTQLSQSHSQISGSAATDNTTLAAPEQPVVSNLSHTNQPDLGTFVSESSSSCLGTQNSHESDSHDTVQLFAPGSENAEPSDKEDVKLLDL